MAFLFLERTDFMNYKPTLEDYEKVGVKPLIPLKPGYVIKGTNDKVFKNLVNDSHTRRYLAKLISLSTGIDYDYLINNMKLSSNNTLEGSVFEHFNEQDVIVTLHDMRIDIEMSIDNKDYNILKNQTTAFKLAGNTYKTGDKYNITHIFYQVCIENYDLYHNDLLITEVNLVDVSSGNYEIVNNFYKEFHINLNNISDECYNNLSERDKYFKLLTLDKKDDLKLLSKGDEIMEDAANKIVDLSNDPGFISELEKQQIHEYAMEYALEKAEERGFDEGKKIAINERNIEIARNSLVKGIDINTISAITGLSVEEINNLSA